MIDLITQSHQVFQSAPPNIERYVVRGEAAADAFLVPTDASFWEKPYIEFLESKSQIAPLIFFNRSDRPVVTTLSNSFSLQNSYLVRGSNNQIVIPYNILQLSNFGKRSFYSDPNISFVGYVPGLTLGRIKISVIENFPYSILNNSFVVRNFGVRNLERQFSASTVVRRKIYGGARSLIGDVSAWRSEYEQSIEGTDLVFCPRGDANSSQRFYEAISAGRIPVVPNTGQEFPSCLCGRSCEVDYILVNRTSSNIGTVVKKFWSCMDRDKYYDFQEQLRDASAHCYNYQYYLNTLFEQDVDVLKRLTI